MTKKIRSCMKNNRGFSLIELIIVVAIVISLTAVMAPNYIKYLDKAKRAVVSDAAESVAQFCKTEFAAGEFTGSGTFRVGKGADGNLELSITSDRGFTYEGEKGEDGLKRLSDACGFDGSRQVKSDISYLIDVQDNIFTRPMPEIEITEVREG